MGLAQMLKVGLALMVKVELVVVSNYQVVNRGGVLQSLALSVCLCAILSPASFIIIQPSIIYEGIAVSGIEFGFHILLAASFGIPSSKQLKTIFEAALGLERVCLDGNHCNLLSWRV